MSRRVGQGRATLVGTLAPTTAVAGAAGAARVVAAGVVVAGVVVAGVAGVVVAAAAVRRWGGPSVVRYRGRPDTELVRTLALALASDLASEPEPEPKPGSQPEPAPEPKPGSQPEPGPGAGSRLGTGLVVIVPGARVFPDGRLSLTLQDRLNMALALYQAGRVGSFLVSGANDLPQFGEAPMMRDHLVVHGVPSDRILVDEAGVSTWATARRARRAFGVTGAVWVTQYPYAHRAATLCRAAGLTATVVAIDPPAGRWHPRVRARVYTREALSNVKAAAIATLHHLHP